MSTATVASKAPSAAKRPASAKHKAPGVSMAQLVKVLRHALPAELKAHGAELPPKETHAVANALARQVSVLVLHPSAAQAHEPQAPPTEEWISTQEAANRCGFSRPFVAALLDSGAYSGRVHRTNGGHRKVLAHEFVALLAQASAAAPKTLAQARKAVDLSRLDDGKAASSAARKQSRERARALAPKPGLGA